MIGAPRGILHSPSGLSPDTARRPQQRNRCVRLDVALMRKSGCRLTISSRQLSAEELSQTVRAHWEIENKLHWMLDVCFGEDDCMVRKDNAPQNLSLLKKVVLNLIRADKTDAGKTSLRLKRKRAAWDDDVRMRMLGLQPL